MTRIFEHFRSGRRKNNVSTLDVLQQVVPSEVQSREIDDRPITKVKHTLLYSQTGNMMCCRALSTVVVLLTAAVSVSVCFTAGVSETVIPLRGSFSGNFKGTVDDEEIGRKIILDERKLFGSRIEKDKSDKPGITVSTTEADLPGALAQPQLGSSRRRKLVLHVGPHKTGTTAFQSWLKINKGISPTLRYPKVCGDFTPHSMWYHHLASGLCGMMNTAGASRFPDCHPTAENLLASIDEVGNSDSSDIIISSETFSKCSVDHFTNIKAVFGRSFDMEVLIVRRESTSLILSRYHQWHKDMQQVTTFIDTVLEGDKRQGLCSYTSLECLQGLGHAFGPEKVHVVSYEGLLASGKELAEVVCDVFSASTGCYAAPSTDDKHYRPNVSPPHQKYSAATIFNRFKIITGCRDPKVNHEDLTLFMGALDKANVPQSCYPLSRIPSVNCDACFHEAILNNDVTIAGVKRYFFLEGAAYIAASDSKLCEYRETAIFENLRTYEAVAAATMQLSSSCNNSSTHKGSTQL